MISLMLASLVLFVVTLVVIALRDSGRLKQPTGKKLVRVLMPVFGTMTLITLLSLTV